LCIIFFLKSETTGIYASVMLVYLFLYLLTDTMMHLSK
jgi:hypothetical protein